MGSDDGLTIAQRFPATQTVRLEPSVTIFIACAIALLGYRTVTRPTAGSRDKLYRNLLNDEGRKVAFALGLWPRPLPRPAAPPSRGSGGAPSSRRQHSLVAPAQEDGSAVIFTPTGGGSYLIHYKSGTAPYYTNYRIGATACS